MSKFSDHDKPFHNLNNLLPEVYQSPVNVSVFDAAFNKFLTKDDTQRVAGFIGIGNPEALVNRQVPEATPHRTAYQLAPTMVTQVGTVETALSFKSFLSQLELMGVNINRIHKWAKTEQFNWAPPVNMDMLINYADYFWVSSASADSPQYFTIESKCSKAQSKVSSYQRNIELKGDTFAISAIQVENNSFVVDGRHTDLFVDGFVFFTKDTTVAGLANKSWTVAGSSHDPAAQTTTIEVIEPIAVSQTTPPTSPTIGMWWFNPSTSVLSAWSGSAWSATTSNVAASISLIELYYQYVAEANCACNNDSGWDLTAWDDNTSTSPPWYTLWLTEVTHPSSMDWSTANGIPTTGDAWYQPSTDMLYTYNGSEWVASSTNFSTIIAQFTNNAQWDYNKSCAVQQTNPWVETNKWVHKSQVQSYANARRAQLPILEYSSSIELNEWTEIVHGWKYRASTDDAFEPVINIPKRIELEPIANYDAINTAGAWHLYANDRTVDVNHVSDLAPGDKIRITSDVGTSEVYTVDSVVYREITSSDPAIVATPQRLGTMVSVIRLQEVAFNSPLQGGGLLHTRIEPIKTSAGDTWRGYHVHWMLDAAATYTVAAAGQPYSVSKMRDSTATVDPTPVNTIPNHSDDGLAFEPQVASITIGNSYQQLVVESPITYVDLVDKFRYHPINRTTYATPQQSGIRVYLNGVQLVSGYVEVVGTSAPIPTAVGYGVTGNVTVSYVKGIQFDVPLKPLDVVKIEVGPSALSDMGKHSVPVRTIEDEQQFALAVAAGTQPTYQAVTRYVNQYQTKTLSNQYPMFTVYNLVNNSVVEANPLFSFAEDSTAAINPAIQRRVAVVGKDFKFEQHLVAASNDRMYGYRNKTTSPTYWFNPSTEQLQYWDGNGWQSQVVLVNNGAYMLCVPTVSKSAPTYPSINQLWFNPNTNTLHKWDSGTGLWTVITNVHVGITDPTLRTVWRNSASYQTTPQYVDSSRAPIAVGDPDGDWGVVDQWMYNSEHTNVKTVSYTQIVTHFRKILSGQAKVPGLLGGGIYTLAQDELNYSIGGTIKEHNDSFDKLISAVNVSNTTPVGVMDFAHHQYALSLQSLKDIFNANVVDLYTSIDKMALVDFGSYAASRVISQREGNESYAQVYGDTTAYDANTKVGVRNWIATTPMMGLARSVTPHMAVVGSSVYIQHHDGHRSVIEYTASEADALSRKICSTVVNGAPAGVVGSTIPPQTMAAYNTAYGSPISPGKYWYTTLGVRVLYRLNVYAVSSTAPSFVVDGVELPDGVKYFNTSTQQAYVKQGTTWTALGGVGDISELWAVVSFAEDLGAVVLGVETKLASVPTPTLLPLESLVNDPSDAVERSAQTRRRFERYVSANHLTPYANLAYTSIDAFTWNYSSSVPVVNPRIGVSFSLRGCWQALYEAAYGTPYPHLEPWVLQGYPDKPVWWDEEYASSTRRWLYDHTTGIGMWANILQGVVPTGRPYPSGAISTGNAVIDGQTLPVYAYVPVNISNSTIGAHVPDAILPPYFATSVPGVRSVYTDYGAEIIAPDADYAYGDMGFVEWSWTTTAQYRYDQAIIAFLMQPMKFLHYAFGDVNTIVAGLNVDVLTERVGSHRSTIFHGDVYDTNVIRKSSGINQWYVNYNRQSGHDTNGDFRSMWTGWRPKLTYQYGGIIDTSTLEVSNKYYDLIAQDYHISLINTGVVNDVWVDAFNVGLVSIPPSLVQYNNESQWMFNVDVMSATSREIEYYGIKQYPFVVDLASNTCNAFTYAVLAGNAGAKRFSVGGDQTELFTPGVEIQISGDTVNVGTYTVLSSVYESTTNRTRINVNEPVAGSVGGGYISVSTDAINWVTGQQVVVSSTKILAAPLQADTPYFVIRVTPQQFKLAETYQDAMDGVAVNLTTLGQGDHQFAEVDSSFVVYGGNGYSQEVWYHYAIDKRVVKKFTPPYNMSGMQRLINLFDGIAARVADVGLPPNIADSSDFDPITGKLVNWANEVERFIDWAYAIRQSRVSFNDTHAVAVDVGASTFTFTSSTPTWVGGTAVVLSTTGTLPPPLQVGTQYYIVNTGTVGTFKLSLSADPADGAAIIGIVGNGSGTTSVGLPAADRSYPSFEINPTKHNVWVSTPLGVLADVVSGPYTDINVQQTIFDQHGNPLSSDDVVVYRDDKRCRLALRPSVSDGTHIGGAHLFTEGYEHYLIFNDYTVGGSLVYDQFFGISSERFAIDYYEKVDYTLRPTLGGYYLLDGQFNRNIEGTLSDAQNLYDTIELSELSPYASRSRSILGYRGRQRFLDLLNISSKSQFLFYKGMVQTKGSVNSVNAMINSRRFVDAKVDEFWAYKVSEYGDARVREYPQINLKATDGLTDDVRLMFLGESEQLGDSDVVAAAANGFTPITHTDVNRWHRYPEQKTNITSSLFLGASVSDVEVVCVSPTRPTKGMESYVTMWHNPISTKTYRYDVVNGLWNVLDSTSLTFGVNATNMGDVNVVYMNLNNPVDAVRVIRRTPSSTSLPIVSCIGDTVTILGDVSNLVTVGEQFMIRGTIAVSNWDSPTVQDVFVTTPNWENADISDISDDVVNGWEPAIYSVYDGGVSSGSGVVSNDGTYQPYSVVFDGVNTVIKTQVVMPSGAIIPTVFAETYGGTAIVVNFDNYGVTFVEQGEGDSEFVRVNSEVIKFKQAGFTDLLFVYHLVPSYDSISPASLTDVKSKVTVQQLAVWDPARGRHSTNATHNVDLYHAQDPARYTVAISPALTSLNDWNAPEVGTVWCDTNALAYLPYYDDQIFKSSNDRLYNWGKLAPWGSVDVYQWVASPVPPEQWQDLVISNATNASIPSMRKASGIVRQVIYKRVRAPLSGVAAAGNMLSAAGYTPRVGDYVIFTSVPQGEQVVVGTQYDVVNVVGTTFQVRAQDDDADVIPLTAGSLFTFVRGFLATDWIEQTRHHQRINAPTIVANAKRVLGPGSATTWPHTLTGALYWLPQTPSEWNTTPAAPDMVALYANGVLLEDNLPVKAVTVSGVVYNFIELDSSYSIDEFDLFELVRMIPDVSQSPYDPAVEDDGTQLIQLYAASPYSVRTTARGTEYYFWVAGSTSVSEVRPNGLPTIEIASQLAANPSPYMVVQLPKDDTYLIDQFGFGTVQYDTVFGLGALREQDFQIPVYYRQVVLRQVSSYINDDDRYVVRFTNNKTLRDQLSTTSKRLGLKNKHQQWVMFRKNQTSTIDRMLWDKLTEALAGHKLGNPTVRVPTLDRELFDAQFGTDTQFGLEEGQTFVDRRTGLATVLAYLSNDGVDFSPLDVGAFLSNHDFSTPAGIVAMMDEIYNNFSAEHVNAIWFEVLADALASKQTFSSLMKTSWIALHGIRVLEVGGMFDD